MKNSLLTGIATLSMIAASFICRASTYEETVCGQMVYRAGWTGEDRGYYVLPGKSGKNFRLLGRTRYGLENGAYFDPESSTIRGAYATISNNAVSNVYILSFDSDTWEEKSCVQLGPDKGIPMMATAVVRDPATGNVYGYFYSETGNSAVWAIADYAGCTRHALASMSLESACPALAAAADGTIYGIDLNASLVKVNKTDGSTTVIGRTQLPLEYPFGACISKDGNYMYATCNTDEYGSGLYKISLADGSTTLVADFGGDIQVMNLYLRPGADSALAPAAPALSVVPSGGSLIADYTLALPSKADDGSTISGTVEWQILREGKVIASGSAPCGSTVSGQLSVESDCLADFYALARNSAGSSARSRVTVFVGTDNPKAPENVHLDYSEGTMSLTWDAVNGSEHGGYIEADKITYTVRRKGAVKAEGLTQCFWSEQINDTESRDSYVYTVEAVSDGHASAATASNEIQLGSYTAPFSTIFNSTQVFGTYGYTVEDVNADRKTWTSTAKGARYQFNKNKDADDWLFTPAIYLEKGKAYELTLKVFANSQESPETFEVMAGAEASATAMTRRVIERTTTAALIDSPESVTGYVSTDTDGPCHIGIHAVSEANMWYLFISELQLSGAVDGATPMMVSGLRATADADGELRTEISFTAPSTTVGGAALTGATAVLTRNGKELSRKAVNANEEMVFTDNPAHSGVYEYGVYILAGNISGRARTVKVFVGPYKAAAPSMATVRETEPGLVHVEWSEVNEDENGTPLNPANITYMIYGTNEDGSARKMLEAPTAATEADFRAMGADDAQDFIYYAVSAFNRDAESAYTLTNIIPVGKAYIPPVTYSNAKSLYDFRLATDKSGGASWSFLADEDGVPAADGDGQCFACNSYVTNRYGDLMTGKIALGASPREAKLSFYTYRHDENDANEVVVSVLCGEEETELARISHSDYPAGKWSLIECPLTDFAGREVQIRFRSYHNTHAYTLVDAITVSEKGEPSSAESVSIPSEVETEFYDLLGRSVANPRRGFYIRSERSAGSSGKRQKIAIR